ncbi:MAG: hypothetical protein WAM92_01035 [Mycobacterium sp.]
MTTEARFLCAVCGAVAGQVRLLRAGEPWTDCSRASLDALADADALIRPSDQAALVDTFYGVAGQPVSDERLDRVADAVAAADVAALYGLGYTYAPFYCPDCAASYCGEHWRWRQFDDGDLSGIEGRCPSGHFHVLCY